MRSHYMNDLARTYALNRVNQRTKPPPFLRNWVALRVDPEAEPTTWTRRVLEVLRSGRHEVTHNENVKNRLDRRERLDEIARAVQEARQGQHYDSRLRLREGESDYTCGPIT